MQNKLLKENRHVFAAYLNMARQNAFETLCHISKLMGIELDEAEKEKENKLWEMKVVKELSTEEIKSERKLKLIKLFHTHFPFLKPIIDIEQRSPKGYIPTELDEDPSEEQIKNELDAKIVYASPLKYYAILENMFRLLNALRNEYTHANPEKTSLDVKRKLQENVVRYAYNCLDGGRRVVKQRFGNFESLQEKQWEEEDKKQKNNKNKPREYKDAYAFLTDTKVRYDKERKAGKFKFVEKKDFPYRMKDDDGILSYLGVLLFVCQFLHKKYIAMFMDKVKPYRKEADEVEKKVLLEIFSVYRVRLPKERYDSERPDYALGLDMLNELQKCPKELYETFNDTDKAKFRVPIKSTSEDVVMDDGVIVENGEVLQIRVQDRFPTMALRYIDQTQMFPKIRFQVSLGHYRYSFYDKKCIDSTEKDRVRVLQKEINGFGRLSEIELKRKEMYGPHIRTNDKVRKDTADSEPYITDCRANYVFNGNRIGFLFFDKELGRTEIKSMNINEDKEIMYIPEKLEWNKDLAKKNKGKKEGTKNAICVPPIAWLSTYELPALIFHHQLCQKLNLDSPDKKISKNPTEYVIIQCIKTYHRFFNDIKEGRLHPGMVKDKESLASLIKEDYAPLQLKDIPVKLVDYLTNVKVNMEKIFKERAEERMEKMLKGTEVRLKMFREERKTIGSKDNKLGKKGYVDIRPGKLADYLAKDMLMFQPVGKDNKNKVTGLNFQVIQASLAVYDKTWEELRVIFENAKLINQKNIHLNHPFLGNLFASKKKPLNTMDFYEMYLVEKINYLKRRLMKGTFSDAFLHKNRMKWKMRDADYYKALAGRYLEEILKDEHKNLKPIELPRGLFERSIVDILKNACMDESQQKFNNDLLVFVNKQIAAYEKGEEAPYNTSFFISAYFNHVLKDKVQPFYISTSKEYKRTYKFFNMINNQKERNALVAQYYTQEEFKELRKKYKLTGKADAKLINYKNDAFDKEKKKPESRGKSKDEIKEIINSRLRKYRSEYDDNERAIRRFMVQDILVFLMAKDLLLKNIGDELKDDKTIDKIKRYKLQNINPTSDTGNILSLSIPFSLTLTLEDGSTRTITQQELKLKNYGDFFRFVYDERLATLLSQTKNVEINRDELEKELLHYDLKRTEIFSWVHAMERHLFKQHPELKNPDKKEEGSHYYYAQKVKNKKTGEEEIQYSPIRQNFRAMLNVPGDIPSQHLEAMVEIRNSFCHNHYVEDLNFGTYQNADLPELANALEKIFKKLVNRHSKKQEKM